MCVSGSLLLPGAMRRFFADTRLPSRYDVVPFLYIRASVNALFSISSVRWILASLYSRYEADLIDILEAGHPRFSIFIIILTNLGRKAGKYQGALTSCARSVYRIALFVSVYRKILPRRSNYS